VVVRGVGLFLTVNPQEKMWFFWYRRVKEKEGRKKERKKRRKRAEKRGTCYFDASSFFLQNTQNILA
jgi:hypothetical protein